MDHTNARTTLQLLSKGDHNSTRPADKILQEFGEVLLMLDVRLEKVEAQSQELICPNDYKFGKGYDDDEDGICSDCDLVGSCSSLYFKKYAKKEKYAKKVGEKKGRKVEEFECPTDSFGISFGSHEECEDCYAEDSCEQAYDERARLRRRGGGKKQETSEEADKELSCEVCGKTCLFIDPEFVELLFCRECNTQYQYLLKKV